VFGRQGWESVKYSATGPTTSPVLICAHSIAGTLERWLGQADTPELDEPRHVEMARYDAVDGGSVF